MDAYDTQKPRRYGFESVMGKLTDLSLWIICDRYLSVTSKRILIILTVLVLTACASSETPDVPPPTPEAQEIVQQPTDTPIPTPVLPTSTPLPQPTEAEAQAQESTAASSPTPVENTQPTDTPAPTPTAEPINCDGTLTRAQTEGPYYTPNTPQRANLVEPGMGGTPLLVTGKVLNQNCEPIAGAMLDFWQTDENGEYDNVGYRMRGHQFADENGNYALETILPNRYPGRTAHIHVKVFAPDGQELLTSQIYIPGISDQTPDSIFQPDLLAREMEPDATGRQHIGFDFVVDAPAATSAVAPAATNPPRPVEPTIEEFPVPPGSRPHDVAPAPDGGVWYTAQGSGELGWLNPATGETRHIALGAGSAPHGVIVGPDGAPWITDGGLNAIVRVEPTTDEVQRFPLPEESGRANLNTATFDQNGVLWFTGQNGVYGRLDPAEGQVQVFDAPHGRGPYGISTAPDGSVYYASLAGSHIARLDLQSGTASPLEPPTPGQGARRVWADSQGRIWVSEWNGGQVAMYNPSNDSWREWPLPGDNPQPYAVYVDEQDMVWLSDFAANAFVRFNPQSETFEVFTLPSPGANIRQILGRPGEIWGAESGTDKLVVIRTR